MLLRGAPVSQEEKKRLNSSGIMQNLVVFMEPSEDPWDTSLNYGNMILNRFCIDQDASFELSEVNYLGKYKGVLNYDEEKGKEFSFLRFYFILIILTYMNSR